MPVFKESDLLAEKTGDNFERRVAHLDNLMIVVCDFKNGPAARPDPPHSHMHEQITYVAEGELLIFLGEDKEQIKAGDIFTVPSGMPHCIQTLSSHVRLIDTFTPVRKDFIK